MISISAFSNIFSPRFNTTKSCPPKNSTVLASFKIGDHGCTDKLKMVYIEILPNFGNYFLPIQGGF